MSLSVLVVVGPSAGGIGTHVRDLVDELPRHDVAVTVVAHPLTAERFGLRSAAPWPRLRSRHAVRELDEVARLADAADVVHAHGFQAGLVAALATRVQARRAGRSTPFVVSLHNQVRGSGLSPRRVVGERAARWVLRRCTLATGASSDLVADARALGAPRAELAEVPSPRVPGLLAVDRDVWRSAHRATLLTEHGLDPARPLAIGLGRAAPQKRFGQLVAASSTAKGPEQWGIVGPGQEGIADLARAHGTIALLGETDDVERWLLAADVLVATSEWEARALVVQEAMAAGTPVVATEAGGLPDLLTGVGELVPSMPAPTFAERVARAVDALVDAPERATRMADEARERARTWPGPDDTAQLWVRWYLSITS